MSPSLRRSLLFVGGTGISLAILTFSAAPGAATRFFSWPWIFYGELLLLIPLVVLGRQLLRDQLLPPRFLSVLGIIAGAIGVSVCCSRQPAFSFESALFLWSGLAWAGAVSVFLTNHAKTSADSETRLRWGARIVGLLLLGPVLASLAGWFRDLSVAAAASDWTSVFGSLGDYRNPHPLGHWNYTGGFALLAAPWFAALSYIESKRWRAIWVGSLLLTLVDLISAFSRGAVLGAGTGLVAVIAMAVYSRAFSGRALRMIVVGGGLALIAIFLSNPRLRSWGASPQREFSPDEGDVQRMGMLQGGVLLLKQRAVIGHGPGMTPFVFPEVRAKLVGGVETSYQLHNGPLQLGVDSGTIGAISWAVLVVTLAAAAMTLTRSTLIACSREQRVLAVSAACGLAAYAGLFVTDYQLNLVPMVFVLGLYAGVVAGTAASAASARTILASRVAGLGLLAIVVVVLLILTPAWRARQAFWRAWQSPTAATVVRQLREATILAPRTPHYFNHLGLRLALDADAESDAAKGSALRAEARSTLMRSLEIDPSQVPVHAAMGWLWLEDEPARATASFRAALALLPDGDGLRFGLALCLLRQGDRDAAIRQLTLECLLNPAFMTSPLWEQPPLAALRGSSARQLYAAYEQVIAHPDTPVWRRSRLTYGAAFARWWFDGTFPTAEELREFNPEEQAAFSLFSETRDRHPAQAPPCLASLQLAFRDPPRAAEILRDRLGAEFDPNAIAGALSRLQKPHGDFSRFVRSPSADGTGIYRQMIGRIHYAVMHRNIDGPGYPDLTPRLADAFIVSFVGPLLPLRGMVPGPIISTLEPRGK